MSRSNEPASCRWTTALGPQTTSQWSIAVRIACCKANRKHDHRNRPDRQQRLRLQPANTPTRRGLLADLPWGSDTEYSSSGLAFSGVLRVQVPPLSGEREAKPVERVFIRAQCTFSLSLHPGPEMRQSKQIIRLPDCVHPRLYFQGWLHILV